MSLDAIMKLAADRLAASIAKYAAIRHLTDREAAPIIGVQFKTVQDFRRKHPEIGYMAPEKAVQREVEVFVRNGTRDNTSRCSMPPTRSYAVTPSGQVGPSGAQLAKTVTLPKEPWA